MSINQHNLAFIGAGNMAGSIIRGLIQNHYPREKIQVSAATKNNTASLESEYGIRCTISNREIVQHADTIVLGVKPQTMQTVCEEIAGCVPKSTLVISLAAGIHCDQIQTWLHNKCPVVRCMSNTPAQIMAGASGLYANAQVNNEQKVNAEYILSAVGICVWVESEALIDTVTAVAGSGPAYFFLFLESMISEAKAQGMDEETASALAIQTALGAAELAKKSQIDIEQLRKNVTSPQGTTEKAIQSFEAQGLRQIVANAMRACTQRARELAKQN